MRRPSEGLLLRDDLPVPSDCEAAWLTSNYLRKYQLLPAQGCVVSPGESVGSDGADVLVNPDEAEVEQRMDIGAEEEAVRYVVRLGPQIRADVSSFEQWLNCAPSDCTSPLIRAHERTPESQSSTSRAIHTPRTAFWLGFINNEAETACAAFVNDERKSQKGRAEFYFEQFKTGAYAPEPEIEAQLAAQFADARSKLKGAERSGLYAYYDAFKHLSAASAYNSLNSLNRYLKHNPDGSYDGHIVGPDNEGLPESLSVLCVGLGIALVMFCTVVGIDRNECELRALLIQTDELRKQLKDSGGGLAMVR